VDDNVKKNKKKRKKEKKAYSGMIKIEWFPQDKGFYYFYTFDPVIILKDFWVIYVCLVALWEVESGLTCAVGDGPH
jgi:hypothetical protein